MHDLSMTNHNLDQYLCILTVRRNEETGTAKTKLKLSAISKIQFLFLQIDIGKITALHYVTNDQNISPCVGAYV